MVFRTGSVSTKFLQLGLLVPYARNAGALTEILLPSKTALSRSVAMDEYVIQDKIRLLHDYIDRIKEIVISIEPNDSPMVLFRKLQQIHEICEIAGET